MIHHNPLPPCAAVPDSQPLGALRSPTPLAEFSTLVRQGLDFAVSEIKRPGLSEPAQMDRQIVQSRSLVLAHKLGSHYAQQKVCQWGSRPGATDDSEPVGSVRFRCRTRDTIVARVFLFSFLSQTRIYLRIAVYLFDGK